MNILLFIVGYILIASVIAGVLDAVWNEYDHTRTEAIIIYSMLWPSVLIFAPFFCIGWGVSVLTRRWVKRSK